MADPVYTPAYNRDIKGINLKARYGITVNQYNDLLQSQNGVCAICEGLGTNGRALAVDHDHISGKVRGLLCNRCNQGIGLLAELENLSKAITYLEKSI